MRSPGVSALLVLGFPDQMIIHALDQARTKGLQYLRLRLMICAGDIATQGEHHRATAENGGESVDKVIQFPWRIVKDVFEAIEPEPHPGMLLEIVGSAHAEAELDDGRKQHKAVLYREISRESELAKLTLRTAVTQVG